MTYNVFRGKLSLTQSVHQSALTLLDGCRDRLLLALSLDFGRPLFEGWLHALRTILLHSFLLSVVHSSLSRFMFIHSLTLFLHFIFGIPSLSLALSRIPFIIFFQAIVPRDVTKFYSFR